jgi:hypothetical protein
LESAKQELSKLLFVTKARPLSSKEYEFFPQWKYKLRKMPVIYYIRDSQGIEEEDESDSDLSDNENSDSETSSQTSEVSQDSKISYRSQGEPAYKKIYFEGFEEDVEEAMRNLEEYLGKHLKETQKVFFEI